MFVRSDRVLLSGRPTSSRCVHHSLPSRPRLRRHATTCLASGNHYDILGVPETASNDEIKNAFRRKAKELHPDVNSEADAEARFKECSLAYEVLVDASSRQAYDAVLLQTRRNGMGNFFRDVDFEDDEYIDLDEWRRERRESYTQPDTSDGGLPDEAAYDDVFRDPAQFLDRLNRFASGIGPSTRSSFWGESSSSAAWRQRVDEYMEQRPLHSRLGRARGIPGQPGEDVGNPLEWKQPGRVDDDEERDNLEWKPPGKGMGPSRPGFGKSSGWNPPSWKRGS